MVNVFIQERNKPAEVRIETPYEQRMREQAEAEQGGVTQAEEKKEKTPEEIQAAQAEIEKTHRQLFDQAFATEKAVIQKSVERLRGDPKMEGVLNKVLSMSTLFKLTSSPLGPIVQ